MLLSIISQLLEQIQKILTSIYLGMFKILNPKIIVDLTILSKPQNLVLRLHRKLIRRYNYDINRNSTTQKVIREDTLYQFSKDIFEYRVKKEVNLREFLKNMDPESKRLVKTDLFRIFYIYTHSVINLNEILSKDELKKKVELKNFFNSIKQTYKLPINFYEFSVFYYDCGLKFLPSKNLEQIKEKDFIDGGAFIGDSALIFEKLYNPKKIYCFEPELRNYNLILETIKLNGLKKLVPIRLGISDKVEKLKINPVGSSSFISNNGSEEIDITTIDKYVSKNALNISLIKLDIEGMELNALIGAKESIIKFKPVLLISIYHNGKEFFETINYIKSLVENYKFIIRKLHPYNEFIETVLIGWNEV